MTLTCPGSMATNGMANKPRELVCAVCKKRIPPGTGAFRRGESYIHVECAEKGKAPKAEGRRP